MDGMLFSKILHMSLIGSYCILVVLGVRIFLQKISRKYSYYLWLIVFLNLCIPFSILSPFSLIPEQVMNAVIETEGVETGVAQTKDILEGSNMIVISADGTQIYQKELQDVIPDANIEEQQVISEAAEISFLTKWKQILPWAEKIWLVGIAIFFIYSLWMAAGMKRRIRKENLISYVEAEHIAEVEGLDTPFLWGIFHPVIYLPADIEKEERNYIIAHEQYHRRRKDYLVKIVLYTVTVLHWFNPFAWVAYSLGCKDMEISCDEAVLEGAKENIRKAYAKSLLKYGAKQNRYVLAVLTFGEPSLHSRIKNVLHYRKKGMAVTVIAAFLTVVVAAGLLFRPAASEETSMDINDILEDSENPPSLEEYLAKIENGEPKLEEDRLPVINNGGEIIKVGSNLYYMEGEKLYSDGKMLYVNRKNDDGSDQVYEYRLEGNGYKRLMQGTLIGNSEDDKSIYYLTTENDRSGQVLKRINESGSGEKVLEISVESGEVISLYLSEKLVFSAGDYEGSAGYFYGDFYSYDFETGQLDKVHFTDDDEFKVLGDDVYYQKYSNQGEESSEIYRTDLQFSREEKIGDSLELLAIEEETGTLLVSKEGKLLRVSPENGSEESILDAEDIGFVLQEYDKIRFTQVNRIEDDIYVKAEQWGYVEGSGWRDSLIEVQYLRVKADGSSFQTWDPDALLEE